MVTNKYVFDMSSGLVKISKRHNTYNVYKLKEIQQTPKSGYFSSIKDSKYKFIWEDRPYESHNYKPYADDDVSSNPMIYLNDVGRYYPFKIRLMI